MSHAYTFSTSAIETVDALQSKINAAQTAFFSGLAIHLTPLTKKAIEVAMDKAREEVIAGAHSLEAQAADLEAEAQALAEGISASHISQRLRNFVAYT